MPFFVLPFTVALLVAATPPVVAQAPTASVEGSAKPDDKLDAKPDLNADPIGAKIEKLSPKADLTPAEIVAAANETPTEVKPFKAGQLDPIVVRLQILLDRASASPGVVDGFWGANVGKAIGALEAMNDLPVDGVLGPKIWTLLQTNDPVLVPYTITVEDAAGPFTPDIPKDYADKAKLDRLAYKNVVQLLAARFHMDEAFVRRLNPAAAFDVAGTEIVVAKTARGKKPKVTRIVADKITKQVRAYDDKNILVVAYPATIGSDDLPSPSGLTAVRAVAIDPVYWYRPAVNFVQGNNLKPLRVPPGPNNPVGNVWIGLDKPTYGIHGTPDPSKIDKTHSHGCVRLTNWDAAQLAKLVSPGVPVEFIDPPPLAGTVEAAPKSIDDLVTGSTRR